MHALAADQPDIAIPILAHSQVLLEDDLVDLIATGHADVQVGDAGRLGLPRTLAARHRGVFGAAEACLALLENGEADIALVSPSIASLNVLAIWLRSAKTCLRATTFRWPCARRCSKLSQTLAGFVAARQWLGSEHAEFATKDACEKATVALAADTSYDEVGAFVQHLRHSGQLTAGMILRALLSGNVVLFGRGARRNCPAFRSTG